MTDLSEIMSQLEAAGTIQNRKIYTRHGAVEPMFGVSYAALGKIAKPVKSNNTLACELWDTKNHDARVLALRITNSAEITEKQLVNWIADADNYILVEGLGGLCAKTAYARKISDNLRDKASEWPASVGWFIVACTAENPNVWQVGELRSLIHQIEAEITNRPNRVRHEMNAAMIAIALRDGNLRKAVLASARRIGPVKVDHGQTGCKTPDIEAYVERTLAHRETLAQRRAARLQKKTQQQRRTAKAV
ncbi:MAG: DNA alkylation repair protein [Acidimicrobiaceae bacterium]|nr:DNA alkylation repair protein [Acidimicrobiaceae bacterium]